MPPPLAGTAYAAGAGRGAVNGNGASGGGPFGQDAPGGGPSQTSSTAAGGYGHRQRVSELWMPSHTMVRALRATVATPISPLTACCV